MTLEDDLKYSTPHRNTGGQQVTRTDSTVIVTHGPTGISVTVGTERSQYHNRRVAVEMIKKALEVIGFKYE